MAPLHLRTEILKSLIFFSEHETLPSPPNFSNPQDQRFYTHFVKGVFRQRGFLDQAISKHVHRKLASISPEVLDILRMGAHDLLFMRTPNHASVNEAVNLCRGKQRKAKGLVNAVLRRISEEQPHDFESPNLSDLLPATLAQRWKEILSPQEAHEIARSLQSPAPLSLRVNPLRTTRDKLLEDLRTLGGVAKASPYLSHAILCEQLPPLNHLEPFQRGEFYVQNPASQIPVYVLDPQPGERILDACAAPGGKTTQIAEHTRNQADIVAMDVSSEGILKLGENISRLGALGITVHQADFLSTFLEQHKPFDRILLDAPCSAWGILREHPEWRWSKNAENPKKQAQTQRQMVEHALRLLKPNGVLVYSVCTFSPEETWKVINGLELENPSPYLPSPLHGFLDRHAVSIKPQAHGMDGFFVARLRPSS